MLLKELEKTIMPHLGKASKLSAMYMIYKFKEHKVNLTREQFILLAMLHEQDGQPQNNLALFTEKNKASLTRLINTMEKKELVVRIPSTADKRINYIHLTKHGRKVFKATGPILKEMTKEVEKGLTKEEIQKVIVIMNKVMTNIKNSQPIVND